VPHSLLADLVVVIHFAFLAFIAFGALLAWRWPWLIWLHVPALAWGVAIVTVGFDCPLTPLEKYFRRKAGEEGYRGGFVDRYIEDVVYPDELTPLFRGLAAVAIVGGYAGVVQRRWLRSNTPAQADRGPAG
jgi:hypothetical protein